MSGFKDSLTVNNYQTLIGTLTSQVAQQFEKVILKTNFNRVSHMLALKNVQLLFAKAGTKNCDYALC